MSQTHKKFIKWGTGANASNAQDIPANFTPSNYTPAQVGSEGTDKISAHLKGLDNKISILRSAGDISETSFALSNNTVSFVNITGFAFANATVRSFKALVSIIIDADTDLFESIEILGIQNASGWSISLNSIGDDSLVDFNITSAGQMQFDTPNYPGFVSGTMKFRAITTSI